MRNGLKNITTGKQKENQTEDRASILYETEVFRFCYCFYWNRFAVSIRWKCNDFIVYIAAWNILDADKRKGYDILT